MAAGLAAEFFKQFTAFLFASHTEVGDVCRSQKDVGEQNEYGAYPPECRLGNDENEKDPRIDNHKEGDEPDGAKQQSPKRCLFAGRSKFHRVMLRSCDDLSAKPEREPDDKKQPQYSGQDNLVAKPGLLFQNNRITRFDNIIRNVQGLIQTIAVMCGSEIGNDHLIDDAFGHEIGQGSFKAVTHLDSNLPVPDGSDDEKTIVHAILTELPLAKSLDAGSFYGIAPQAVDKQDGREDMAVIVEFLDFRV